MHEVTLKQGHPTGVYHRAGMEFTRAAPVRMQKVPEAVAKDPWLVVTEVAEPEKPRGRGSRAASDD